MEKKIETRIIKFRGKREDNGEWVYGYYVVDPSGKHRIYLQPFEDATSNTYYFVIHETVGQLLTSQTNPNFFEGDIITDTLNLSHEPDLENCYAVTWENFHEIAPTEFVIGNVHDNPELVAPKNNPI